MTVRRRRTLAWAGGILGVYILSGAALKVAFGYANRGRLYTDDASWFRRQFAPYGPLPVAALFGPNFREYLGEIPNTWRIVQEGEADLLGDTLAHRRGLRRILERAPSSLWAPSTADLLARLESRNQRKTVEERAAECRFVVDRYPDSPYAAFALRQMARIYAEAGLEADYEQKARAAYDTLLTKYPGSPYEAEAFRFLAESERRRGDLAGAARRAQQWIDTAPVQERFSAWITLAEIRRDQGQPEEAKQAAQQALEAVKAFRQAVRAGLPGIAGSRLVRLQQEASLVEQRALGIK